jgi:deazaflavin-dependent oxidoreductase (nitroreductase family)
MMSRIPQVIKRILGKTKNRNLAVIEDFRANNGQVGGFFRDKSLLLLHTTGAKSGKKHIIPLIYLQDGDRFVIIASKGGAQSNPDWYYNLVTNPKVKVELGKEEFVANAVVVQEPERSLLFNRMTERYPFYAEYQRKTDRIIPVIILSR